MYGPTVVSFLKRTSVISSLQRRRDNRLFYHSMEAQAQVLYYQYPAIGYCVWTKSNQIGTSSVERSGQSLVESSEYSRKSYKNSRNE
jgi:hypothetical protein